MSNISFKKTSLKLVVSLNDPKDPTQGWTLKTATNNTSGDKNKTVDATTILVDKQGSTGDTTKHYDVELTVQADASVFTDLVVTNGGVPWTPAKVNGTKIATTYTDTLPAGVEDIELKFTVTPRVASGPLAPLDPYVKLKRQGYTLGKSS